MSIYNSSVIIIAASAFGQPLFYHCKGLGFNAKNHSIFSRKSANFLKKNVVFLPYIFAKQAISKPYYSFNNGLIWLLYH
jgi:hypothetical protein